MLSSEFNMYVLFVKRAKWYKLKSQRLSLIPQPKAYTPSSSSSLSSSVSKYLTPRQAKPEKRVVASELGENMMHFSFVLFKRRKINVLKNLTSSSLCEGNKVSKSIIRSSYSGYKGKDFASSSSVLRLPLPKMGFFDSVCFQRKHNLAAMYILWL